MYELIGIGVVYLLWAFLVALMFYLVLRERK